MSDNGNPALEEKAVVLPLPPDTVAGADYEMEIYVRFMRYLRHSPGKGADLKILSAIQFTADMLNLSDALVAKTLVDLGLRASRRAFPSEYLDHIDRSLMNAGWSIGGLTFPVRALRRYWECSENRVVL